MSEERNILKIVIVGDIYLYEILKGTGKTLRKEEHFEGLLAALNDRNMNYCKKEVETHDLKECEEAV